MTSNKYKIKEGDFCIEILDNGIPMHYSTIVNRLNEQHETIQSLNQLIQDNEDLVSNWFIENWSKLDDEQKQSAHLELGIDIDYGEDLE